MFRESCQWNEGRHLIILNHETETAKRNLAAVVRLTTSLSNIAISEITAPFILHSLVVSQWGKAIARPLENIIYP